jgi:hypothetical protein
MAVSLATGFIGGPVMPTLFIGGAGLATHLLIPGLPIVLAVSATLVDDTSVQTELLAGDERADPEP